MLMRSRFHPSRFQARLKKAIVCLVLIAPLAGCRTSNTDGPAARFESSARIGWLGGPFTREGDAFDGVRIAVDGSQAGVANWIVPNNISWRSREWATHLSRVLTPEVSHCQPSPAPSTLCFLLANLRLFDLDRGKPSDPACLPVSAPKRCFAPGKIQWSVMGSFCQ